MQRRVVGHRRDERGEWWAELDCLHRLAMPDGPTPEGTEVACARCDAAELPEGLERVRATDVFDEASVPAGLQRRHRVADGVWGVLVVLEGDVGFHIDTVPPLDRVLGPGARQPIPPGVPHEVELRGPVRFQVEFHRRPG